MDNGFSQPVYGAPPAAPRESKWWHIAVLIALGAVFLVGALTSIYFLTPNSLGIIFFNTAIVGILAIGQMLVMVQGGV